MKLSTVALLLLPALFFAGWAISLRGTSGTVLKTESGKFELVVNEIKFKKVPLQQGGPQIAITFYVSHKGPEPKWWQTGVRIPRLGSMKFVNQKGKEYQLYSFSGGPRAYDAARQSHVLECVFGVPNPNIYDITKPGTFKGAVIFADPSSPEQLREVARFSVPVQVQ